MSASSSSEAKNKACIGELLDQIRARPALYDPASIHYRRSGQTKQDWQEIFDVLVSRFPREDLEANKMMSPVDLQWKFRRLKSTLINYKRRAQERPDATKPWCWLEKMSFFDEVAGSYTDYERITGSKTGYDPFDEQKIVIAESMGNYDEEDLELNIYHPDDSGIEESWIQESPDNDANVRSASTSSNSRNLQAQKRSHGGSTSGVSKKQRSSDVIEVDHEKRDDVKKDEDETFGNLVTSLMRDVPKRKKHRLRIQMLSLISEAACEENEGDHT